MTKQPIAAQPSIRVGVGGWSYEPWRQTFYPPDLPQKRELEYASRQLTTIEINATYYRTQKADSFAKWRHETPDDFMFSVKAPRYATNRKVLAEAGPSIEYFLQSGLVQLGAKLGPILWQFAPTKPFEPEDFARFLDMIPRELGGRPLRNAVDVRHPSFMSKDFVALARRHRVAIVYADSDDYPSFADVTADFVYGRLMRSQATLVTGYPVQALDRWAERASLWAAGGEPADLNRVDAPPPQSKARDVFIYVISGAKERAPVAARELLSRLSQRPAFAAAAKPGNDGSVGRSSKRATQARRPFPRRTAVR